MRVRFTLGIILPVLAIVMMCPFAAHSAHRLDGSRCVDCHALGAGYSDVVNQSHGIRADAAMAEIISNGTWTPGTPLPCAYCHDDTARSVRENRIGVKDQFTSASISRHPVDPYASNSQNDPTALDCIDCHDSAIVEYVRAGVPSGTALSPNIHERDVSAVSWTPAPGLLAHTATYRAWAASATSPTNSGSNSFCTNQCHDAQPGTGYDADQVYHSYDGPLVSLETGSTFHTASQIGGCLDESSSNTGCHAVHNSPDNTDLVTAVKWGTTSPIARSDCGSCHVFDDPPTNRNVSDFFARGHGQYTLDCVNCHNSLTPHFKTDGTPVDWTEAGRLNFVLDVNNSGFSSPPKSETSICTSSSCHSGYYKHAAYGSGTTPAGPVVACLDCHDPHGAGVAGNVAFIRRTPPVSSPASSLYYANQGDWYNSTSPPSSGNFSDYVCDQEDCHGGSGPGPYVDIMSGIHPTAVSDCTNCHDHQSEGHSFAPPCDGCHGSPPVTGGDMDHSAGLNPIDVAGFLGAHDGCLVCHGKDNGAYHPNYSSTMHSDGLIAMNSAVGYDGSGGCDSACHANDTTHQMGTSSSRPASLVAFGTGSSASCRSCHETGAYDSPAIPVTTASHLDADGSGSTWSYGDCKGCHAGHASAPSVLVISLPPSSWNDPSGRLTGTNMQASLGLAYTMTSHNGIALGGSGTAASAYTTEAEMCWGCHDSLASPVSEWGYNTDTNGTSFPVVEFSTNDGTDSSLNFGWIYNSASYTTKISDWTAQGYWRNPYDTAIARRIVSVHSANFDTTGQSSSYNQNVSGAGVISFGSATLEHRSQIRCTYCHDVHGLRRALNASTDLPNPLPKPYLRGTWMGNPYPPDLPPRNWYTYTELANNHPNTTVPRPNTNARDKGGFFIDRNSGNPTSGRTLSDTSGLCTLCHGTNVDTMDYYSGSMWLSTNGHSNAVLGGTGTNRGNLFDARRGETSYPYRVMGFQYHVGWPDLGLDYDGYDAPWQPTYTWTPVRNSGWYGGTTGSTTRLSGDYSNWYGTGIGSGTGVAGGMAHEFTCSKCHSPHATGLPALLTTDCLDTGLSASFSKNSGKVNPTATTASNCHRKTALTNGWYWLAPGQ